MLTADPVMDEALHTLECERWQEAYDATRPRCAACGEPVRGEWCYDFSGDMEDGYVLCETCMSHYFNSNKQDEVNEIVRAYLFDEVRRYIGR